MVQVPIKAITLAEFLQQPETQPASEFINGQIVQKPMPQGEHSLIQGELVTAINAVLKPAKIARAFPELRCTFGDDTVVPDVAVFRWDRIPRTAEGRIANHFAIAPDWTIEILSPGQSPTKVIKKIFHCITHGTQCGWLIDTQEQVVLTYGPTLHSGLFEAPDALLPVPDFAQDFRLTFGVLFGWLME
ncbi:MAG: Uma2 family endonuclease [Thermosynechococcaceae cyanobacterium]